MAHFLDHSHHLGTPPPTEPLSRRTMQRDEQARRDDEQWTALLEWLRDKHGMDVGRSGLLVERRDTEGAGKGLFALEDCPPSTTLFTIPAKAMINIRTLSPLYAPRKGEDSTLSATQMISLHLALHRPGREGNSGDPLFGPFISTMPREFDGHPLSWKVHAHIGTANDTEKSFLNGLPPRIVSALQSELQRFLDDWAAVCSYMSSKARDANIFARQGLSRQEFCADDPELLDDYLWAWLNVNTRCIYYALNSVSSAPENLTLCPILDFANHRPSNTHIFPVLPSEVFPPIPGSSSGAKRHGLGGDYMFLSSSQTPVHKDDELYLRYGGHANRTLFNEYGFINPWKEGQCYRGEFAGEVDLQDVVERLLETAPLGAKLREVLEEEGYWGEWTLHSSPTPAHPSYRLISALRLYHCATETNSFDKAVEEWRAVLLGESEMISQDNESAWRKTLLDACEHVKARAESGVAAGGSLPLETPWAGWMREAVEMLWREEGEVASVVAESIRAGEEF